MIKFDLEPRNLITINLLMSEGAAVKQQSEENIEEKYSENGLLEQSTDKKSIEIL